MKKVMIVPIVFAILTMLVVIGYAAIFFLAPIPMIIKIGIALLVVVLIGAMGYVVMERNRELAKEEKDDFSKY